MALRSCIRLSQGRLPDSTWKRHPGRPCGRWIDQLWRDNNCLPADQWKLAIKHGHGGRATLQFHDYATTWPYLTSHLVPSFGVTPFEFMEKLYGSWHSSFPGNWRWRFGDCFWPIYLCDRQTDGPTDRLTELRWLRRAESSSCIRV